MHRLSTSFVLGYHGCEAAVAEKLLAGEPFKASSNDYDWLGPGIYFWKPTRAAGSISRSRRWRGGNPTTSLPSSVRSSISVCAST